MAYLLDLRNKILLIDLFNIGFINFNLFDLIDILIVTSIFYWLYRSLKDTFVIQILFGLVVIIGLSFITESIKLKSINWILRTLSDIWLIAFIIIFQTEIRKLLLLITRSKIFQYFVKNTLSEMVDELEDAIFELARSHIGALIILPRTQNVLMSVSEAVMLNASLSKELLLSIFNTKSPLHDGAVIIEKDVIIAAKCYLPHYNSEDVMQKNGKNLGTRHKSALALTQEVDAIVIVVSEETGSISIADGDDLMYDVKQENLYNIIRDKLLGN